MRPGLFVIAAALLGGCSRPPAPQPAPSPPAARIEAPAPVPAAPPALPPPAPVSPVIAAALRAVTRAMLEGDLGALVQPGRGRFTEAELRAVAGHLGAELAAAGYRVRRAPVFRGPVRADSVIADRDGDDPGGRVVLVCAHYDAVPGSPGADDNGSGVAAMLAVARAVSGVKTHAALRFVAFPFEESGLVGSLAYVRSLVPAERDRIAAVLDLEMVAFRATGPGSQRFPEGLGIFSDDPLPESGDFIGAVGLTSQPEPLDALRAARAYVPELPVAMLAVPPGAVLLLPDLLRSDHAPFWLAGRPAVMITDTASFRNPNYHRGSDALDTLDLEFAARVTRWVTAGVLLLAGPA